MTDTGALIKAKADAVNALATALTNAMGAGQVENLKAVENFLTAWTAGVNAMVPAEVATFTDAEPAIGSVVSDKDGTPWTRASNGLWQGGQQSAGRGTWTWAELQEWAPLIIL